jgi:hypothetical protein
VPAWVSRMCLDAAMSPILGSLARLLLIDPAPDRYAGR